MTFWRGASRDLLTRPRGRPSHAPLVRYGSFDATRVPSARTPPRRGAADHADQLFGARAAEQLPLLFELHEQAQPSADEAMRRGCVVQ
jgi:hypothetical protein